MSAEDGAPFDPLAILSALERHRVPYVLVGELARVVHGTDEIADRVEICPRLRSDDVARLERALEDLGVEGVPPMVDRGAATTIVESTAGALAISPRPDGSAGYDDLRRKATREPIGGGLRVAVPDPRDLARIASATRNPQLSRAIAVLRRVAEIDRGPTRA